SDGFDPVNSRWAASGTLIANAIFDPIVVWDENLEIAPYLAEELRPDDDFMAWEVQFRPGITFHDGEPLNAEAWVQQILAAKDSALLGAALRPIEDAEPVDELTARVIMNTPWAAFPASLTAQGGMVRSPSMGDD